MISPYITIILLLALVSITLWVYRSFVLVHGSYARVCNDGTNTCDIATLSCIQLGYQGKVIIINKLLTDFLYYHIFCTIYIVGESLPYNPSLYSGSPRGIIYISNYTCNETGCAQSISFAYDEQCFGGQKDLIVRCYNRSNQELIIIIIFIILQVLTARMKAILLTTQGSQQHLTVQLK